ncbi:MAG: quinolone resistance protein [Amphibacillus sp.]|nr:quinolone resistance protein [Amphibacillus sp.]
MKKYVHFIECLLNEVDFYHSKWSNIFFEKCELTGANLSNTKLKGINLSDSSFDYLTVRTADLYGCIVNPIQAQQLSALFGLIIK